jgi:hypothetical protein
LILLSKRATLMTGSLVAAVAAFAGTAAASQVSDLSAQPSSTAVHAAPVDVPPALLVPDGNEETATLGAKGVQTYTCTNGAWTFLEPAATLWKLNDPLRRPVALHTRGPVWISTKDGSAVNAAAVPGASVPQQDAVPELLLKATATRGDGLFGSVSYVQRLDTHGGVAPTGSCTDGAQVGVPYSATYVFYAPTD